MCRVVVWTQTDDAFLAEAADKGVYAGSTASTLLVRQCRKFGPITLMCGNVGDSRCVLSREGTAFDMSVDHKPGNSDESKRIEEAGGWVHNGRLHGVLAVSRAFGDIEHKKMNWAAASDAPALSTSEMLHGPKNNILVAEPEVVVETVLPHDEFLIIACDGLWDVMTSQQAVHFVRRFLGKTPDVRAAVKALVDCAVNDLESPDNVSAVIVVLNQSADA